jgi:hypothetical protein
VALLRTIASPIHSAFAIEPLAALPGNDKECPALRLAFSASSP